MNNLTQVNAKSLRYGTTINYCSKMNETFSDNNLDAMVQAAKDNNLDMVKRLLLAGVKDFFGLVLEQAVKNNNINIVELLLSAGVEDFYGNSLEYAACNNNVNMVQRLLTAGSIDFYGDAMKWAIQNKNIYMANMLLEARVNRDDYGSEWRVLEQVAENNDIDIVECLLTEGLMDLYGGAMKHAIRNNNISMANILMDHRYRCNCQRTLEHAVENNVTFVVERLLLAGVTDEGSRALGLAVKNLNEDMIELLQQECK